MRFLHGGSAQSVISPQFQDHDFRIVLQEPADAAQSPRRGIAADAGVDDTVRITLLVQQSLETRGIILPGGNAESGGQAVAESQNHGKFVLRRYGSPRNEGQQEQGTKKGRNFPLVFARIKGIDDFSVLHNTGYSVIQIHQLKKTLYGGGHQVNILTGIDLVIPNGQFVAITGASGSGKTTLLSLIAGLDTPTSGSILVDQKDITNLNEDELASLRAERFGFIFQNFNLIPTLTALENVVLAAELNNTAGAHKKSEDLLGIVGLGDRMHHYPTQLSGGEQQRLSLARAFVNEPDYVLADEPTGNLDSKNTDRIIHLLLELHKVKRATVVLVTHEPHIAEQSQRILTLADGALVGDSLPHPTHNPPLT